MYLVKGNRTSGRIIGKTVYINARDASNAWQSEKFGKEAQGRKKIPFERIAVKKESSENKLLSSGFTGQSNGDKDPIPISEFVYHGISVYYY